MMNGQTIAGKLLYIQQRLKAPKGQYNEFGKYRYRSCEDILEGVKPLLAEAGAVLTLNDEITEIGGRVYVKASAILRDTETDSFITNTAYAREPEDKKGADASQITGAASSYARKYALNGLFCIDDVKDADATNTHGRKAAATAADQRQQDALVRSEIMRIMNTFPNLRAQVRDRYGDPESITGISAQQCLKLLRQYEADHAA